MKKLLQIISLMCFMVLGLFVLNACNSNNEEVVLDDLEIQHSSLKDSRNYSLDYMGAGSFDGCGNQIFDAKINLYYDNLPNLDYVEVVEVYSDGTKTNATKDQYKVEIFDSNEQKVNAFDENHLGVYFVKYTSLKNESISRRIRVELYKKLNDISYDLNRYDSASAFNVNFDNTAFYPIGSGDLTLDDFYFSSEGEGTKTNRIEINNDELMFGIRSYDKQLPDDAAYTKNFLNYVDLDNPSKYYISIYFANEEYSIQPKVYGNVVFSVLESNMETAYLLPSFEKDPEDSKLSLDYLDHDGIRIASETYLTTDKKDKFPNFDKIIVFVQFQCLDTQGFNTINHNKYLAREQYRFDIYDQDNKKVNAINYEEAGEYTIKVIYLTESIWKDSELASFKIIIGEPYYETSYDYRVIGDNVLDENFTDYVDVQINGESCGANNSNIVAKSDGLEYSISVEPGEHNLHFYGWATPSQDGKSYQIVSKSTTYKVENFNSNTEVYCILFNANNLSLTGFEDIMTNDDGSYTYSQDMPKFTLDDLSVVYTRTLEPTTTYDLPDYIYKLEGTFNLDQIGTYKIKLVADTADKYEYEFVLNVIEPSYEVSYKFLGISGLLTYESEYPENFVKVTINDDVVAENEVRYCPLSEGLKYSISFNQNNTDWHFLGWSTTPGSDNYNFNFVSKDLTYTVENYNADTKLYCVLLNTKYLELTGYVDGCFIDQNGAIVYYLGNGEFTLDDLSVKMSTGVLDDGTIVYNATPEFAYKLEGTFNLYEKGTYTIKLIGETADKCEKEFKLIVDEPTPWRLKVVFDNDNMARGGVYVNVSQEVQNNAFISSENGVISLDAFTKPGFKFKGYYRMNAEGEKVLVSSSSYTTFYERNFANGEATVYVEFEVKTSNSFSAFAMGDGYVTLDGVVQGNGVFAEVELNESITVGVQPQEGKEFLGWYLSINYEATEFLSDELTYTFTNTAGADFSIIAKFSE